MISGDKNPHVRKRFAPSSRAFSNTAVATAFLGSLDAAAFPPSKAWRTAKPVLFDRDWQGKNPDPHRRTEVRLLWTSEFLYLKFVARFRRITVFENADADGRRDKLWDRDVAEVFVQPDPQQTRRYKEFEVSPNGFWIDLEIANGALQHIKSGLQRRVSIDEATKTWVAELAIPIKSLTQTFGPASLWRVNFFRVEGPTEPRFYSSWQPTSTPQPNFHVPERFGYLKFKPMPSVKPRKKNTSKSKK
ncbi:MAG TPA: carbohydrate-binding family 9-like protein [Candidatus Acidoferrum sp.]|nr:carbohydrate-binding family 9-like protein [Candidatus Acidoferrum sp.]